MIMKRSGKRIFFNQLRCTKMYHGVPMDEQCNVHVIFGLKSPLFPFFVLRLVGLESLLFLPCHHGSVENGGIFEW